MFEVVCLVIFFFFFVFCKVADDSSKAPQWGAAVMKLRAPPVWNHRSSLWFLFSVMLSLSFPTFYFLP
jgi:hypothetical protein